MLMSDPHPRVASPGATSSGAPLVPLVPLAAVTLHGGVRPAPASHEARNPGVPFDLSWLDGLRTNRSAVERRVSTLAARRSLKKDAQAAWLLKAITCIDLTTLSGDDTASRVRRLCAKARRPVRADLLDAMGIAPETIRTGAVCVYHRFVGEAVDALGGSGIPVAAVSTGFPAGLIPHPLKLREIEASVSDGAAEIDIVITREHVLTGNWQALYDEVRDFRAACGDAHMKAILATGDIQTLSSVARASMVCMMAGADFIKTSTGKESVNATLDVSLVMVRMIREYLERTGVRIGFKPAGGVSSAKGVLGYQVLMKEELGRAWLEPTLLRIGASSLLADIERQLEHHVSGRYSAFYRHPAA
jgi:deoxyribose-phosphate aldolase